MQFAESSGTSPSIGLPAAPLPSLQRLAAQELRHLANEPGGLADKKLLQCRQTIDKTEAHVAHEAQQVRLVGEQPLEPIGRNPHGDRVEAPPTLIAFEHRKRAGIKP